MTKAEVEAIVSRPITDEEHAAWKAKITPERLERVKAAAKTRAEKKSQAESDGVEIEPAKCCGSTSPLALITLNIGGVLTDKARVSMMAAAKRWKADFVEITKPLKPVGGRPHWQKVFLADLAEGHGYKRAAYFDADILIRSDCPSPFDATPAGTFGVVWDGDYRFERYETDYQFWGKALGRPIPTAESKHRPNSGFFVFEPTAHKALFAAWRAAGEGVSFRRADVLVDQPSLGVLIQDAPVTWLPLGFNAQYLRSPRKSGVMAEWTCHFTGPQSKPGLHKMEWQLSPEKKKHMPSPRLLGDIDLAGVFDRVVCINLDRRHDRWQQFLATVPQPWPFAPIQPTRGIDKQRVPVPSWVKVYPGIWGCLRAHARAVEDALNDGVGSLLIIEDDILFCPDFDLRARLFLRNVPDDWQALFLGGKHTRGQRVPVNRFVEMPAYIDQGHAYALRGAGLRVAYEALHSPRPRRIENDQLLGEVIEAGKMIVYCPRDGWLIAQRGGYSDNRDGPLPAGRWH